jgi:hypothetical protein
LHFSNPTLHDCERIHEAMTHSQSAQRGHSEHEPDGDLQTLQPSCPARGPMTVQIFEPDEALEIVNRDLDTNEDAALYRASLPIRYVDRETFERMR